MSKQNDFSSIGQVYGNMLNSVKHKLVSEGKIGTVKPGEIGQAPLIKGGPQTTSGYMPSKIDRSKMSAKELKDNLYNIKNLSSPSNLEEDEESEEVKPKGKKPKKGTFTKIRAAAKKAGYSKESSAKIAGAAKAKLTEGNKGTEVTKESRKIITASINNFMRNKSIFDKLYENVMNTGMDMNSGNTEDTSAELDALGIDTDSETDGDEVTFTLDRATAEKLLDVIGAAMGQGHEETSDENEYGGEEDSGESDGEEDEEELGGAKDLSKEVNYGKNNKVGNLKTQSGGASSSYTDKVGSDGDHGHALVNAKQPNMGANNKVSSLKTGKSMFEQ